MNKFENLTQVDIENTINDIERIIVKELKKDSLDKELISRLSSNREELLTEKYSPLTLEEVSNNINKLTEEKKHIDSLLEDSKYTDEAKILLLKIVERELTVVIEIYHKKSKSQGTDDRVKAIKAIRKK